MSHMRFWFLSGLVPLLASILTPADVAQAGVVSATYFLTTGSKDDPGQKVNVDESVVWSVKPTSDVAVSGGSFWMKAGSKTSDAVTFSLYSGRAHDSKFDGLSLLASKSLSYADFSGQVNNPQQPQYHSFQFAGAPVTIRAGQYYTLVVASNARDNGAYQYLMREPHGGEDDDDDDEGGSTPLFLDGGNNPVTPASPNTVAVPEPGSLALMGIGATVAACAARRRRRAAGC